MKNSNAKNPVQISDEFIGNVITAIIGGVWTFAANEMGVTLWLSFVTWSLFFLTVSNPVNGTKVECAVKLTAAIFLGNVLGVVMINVLPFFAGMHANLAAGLVVSALVLLTGSLQKVKGLEIIPAYFVGWACFFGTGVATNLTAASFHSALLPGIYGVFIGLMNVALVEIVLGYRNRNKATVLQAVNYNDDENSRAV